MIDVHYFLVRTLMVVLQEIGSGMFILPAGVTLPKHLIPSTHQHP